MLRRYAYYQKERTNIYRLKEIEKLPAPWSENPMFQKYKFTMTKRWLDRESKNLINGILLREDISLENKILNAVMFRMTNKFKLFEIFPESYINFELVDDDYLADIKDRIIKSGVSGFFTDAYFISGTLRSLKLAVYGKDKNIPKGESNPTNSVISIIKFLKANQQVILRYALESKNQEEVVDGINSLYGLGKFISYQSYVDFTYIPEYKFSETEFVRAGPGAERGLNHLFEDFDGLNFSEAIFWLRDNIVRIMKENDLEWEPETWFDFLPVENRVWTVMDIQNSMCEFDKSTRIWTEELQKENGKRVRKFKILQENHK